MTDAARPPEEVKSTGEEPRDPEFGAENPARVLPLLGETADQRVLIGWIEEREGWTSADQSALEDGAFDLCIVDSKGFDDHEETLTDLKEAADPVLLPYLLVLGESEWDVIEGKRGQITDSAIESSVDEIVSMPLKKAELRWRIQALLRLRSQSLRMQQREIELRKFRRAAKSAGHAIYITDIDGTITYVNPAFERITGYEASEAIGKTPRIIKSGEMEASYYEDLWETLERGEVWDEEITNRRKDGERYYAEQTIAPVTDPDGDISAYLAVQKDITERKRRAETLRQYKQAVESSKDLLAAVDSDFTYLFANEVYREYHDFDRASIEEGSLRSVLSEAEFEQIKPEVKRALDGQSVQLELTRDHPEKGERMLDVRLFPLEGETGDVHGVGASMRDITKIRERQAAVKRESAYRRLMSEVNHGLMRATSLREGVETVTELIGESSEFTCTFTYLDPLEDTAFVCERNSGFSEQAVEALHTDSYLEAVAAEGILHMADVTTPPYAHHQTDTESHPGLGFTVRYEEDQFGVLTVHLPPGSEPSKEGLDVLETIANDLGYFVNNQQLKAKHKSFTDIVERIDDPVMLQNRDGTYRVLNEAVAAFAGRSKEELIGLAESALMDAETAARVDEMKTRVLENEKPVSYQVEPTFPDGRTCTFSTTRYPYYDNEGNLDGTLAVCRDITDLEEQQQQLRVLDRVLRHNVNNNMNVVQGYAEMIRNEAESPLDEYGEKIVSNSGKLLEIAHKQREITEFLADPEPMDRIDLGQVLDKVIDRLEAEHPPAQVTVEGPKDTSVWAITSIEEAIEELLRNSIIHAAEPSPTPTVEISQDERTTRIRVIDENRNIADMDQSIISGEGEITALQHGSGLGLWLVKLIVEHSDGSIRYEPNEPAGNVVEVSLGRVNEA